MEEISVAMHCVAKMTKGRLTLYKIIDNDGNSTVVKADDLKEAIRKNQIVVDNITLTKDNRILLKNAAVSKEVKHRQKTVNSSQYADVIKKAKAAGLKVKTITTLCNHKCYIISSSDIIHTLYIPDDVTCIGVNKSGSKFINYHGKFGVIGGSNLKDISGLFGNCNFGILDLSLMDTKEVVNMDYMFCGCKVNKINLSCLNTSKVESMKGMFNSFECKDLSLESFDTSKVRNMESMFSNCKTNKLDLNSFNTKSVYSMVSMFAHCAAKEINLSSFNTNSVISFDFMFASASVKELDLRHFNFSNCSVLHEIFLECKANIDLTGVKLSNTQKLAGIFDLCKGDIKVTDKRFIIALKESTK